MEVEITSNKTNSPNVLSARPMTAPDDIGEEDSGDYGINVTYRGIFKQL
jgi:hypothetical protein